MGAEHLSSLQVSNYRGFRQLKIEGLRDLNVFGGPNGIGKSSLLEAVFHLQDRNNPTTLFRPHGWRGITIGPRENAEAITQTFHDRDLSKSIIVAGGLKPSGKISVEYTFGRFSIPMGGTQAIQQGDMVAGSTETSFTATGEGIHVIAARGNRTEFDATLQFGNGGGFMHIAKNDLVHIPQSVMVSAILRGDLVNSGDRYSSVKRQGNVPQLIEFLKLVHPEVQALELLSMGGNLVLHANIGVEKENWVPLPFLGEGAVILASAILAIADCQGGSVLLDELDAAVHHASLHQMWSLLLQASKRFDVQLFATTHSEESLEALIDAVAESGSAERVSYQRLRVNKKGEHSAAAYSGQELLDTIRQKWEVR